MRPADAALLEAVDPEWDEESARTLLERPASAGMVARAGNGSVLGFIIGHTVRGEAEILQITVSEPLRRRGIGSALLEAFLAAHASKACFLEVRQDNVPAIALYRRLGFTPDGIRKDYYRDGGEAVHAVVMRLDTPNAGD